MDMLNMLAFLVGGGITLTAFIILVGRLFMIPVNRCAEAIKASLWKPFLIGLVNAVFFILLASLMFNFARNQLSGLPAGFVAMIALAILAALGILESIGLSGFSYWLEERFANDERTLNSSLKSTLFLVLACMAPFVGWFLLTPFVIATSLGAAMQTVFRRREKVA
jgi:hypothetical protein